MNLLQSNQSALLLDTLSVTEIENWLISKFSEQLAIPEKTISTKALVTSLGLDSMDAVMIAGELEEWLCIEVPSTLLWDYPTISQIATYVFKLSSENYGDNENSN